MHEKEKQVTQKVEKQIFLVKYCVSNPNLKFQGLESESENIDSNLLLAVLALLMI